MEFEELEPEPPDHQQGYTIHSRCPKQRIKVNHKVNRHGPNLPSFSGKENYLQWEDDMEDYFWSYKTLENEKLPCALNALRGEALKWWRKDANERWQYKEPRIKTWGQLKWLMNEEYVTRQLTPRGYSKKTPQAFVKHTPISTSMSKTMATIQGKCSTSKVTLELMCYKCKMQGHTAKFCSTRNQLAQEKQHQSFDAYPNDAKLSTSKDLIGNLQAIDRVIESLKQVKKEAKEPSKVEKVQVKLAQHMIAPKLSDKSLLEPHKIEQCKSSNPCELHELTCYRCQGKGHKAKECPTRRVVSSTLLDLKTDSHKPISHLANSDFISSTSSIMHLPLPKVVETGTEPTKKTPNMEDALLIQEEPPDSHQQVIAKGECMGNKDAKPRRIISPFKEEVVDPIPPKLSYEEDHFTLDNIPLKEKPPDPTHHCPTSQNRGKVLDSQNRMKPNLLSLGAGHLVLRTKPFEEGGYDRLIDHGLLTGRCGSDSVVEFSAKYTKDKRETNFLGKHVEDKGKTTFLDMFQLPKLNDSSTTQAAEPDSRTSPQQPSPEDPEDTRPHIKTLRTLQSELSNEVTFY